MTSDEFLDHLIATLHRIRELLPSDVAEWEGDEVLRLAVERLWITAGELAVRYSDARGLPAATNPWSELHRFRSRLAHAVPGEISPQRVWDESHADLERILAEVARRA